MLQLIALGATLPTTRAGLIASSYIAAGDTAEDWAGERVSALMASIGKAVESLK
jgi:hypothetical protein